MATFSLSDGTRVDIIDLDDGFCRIVHVATNGTQINANEFRRSLITPDLIRSGCPSLASFPISELQPIIRAARVETENQ